MNKRIVWITAVLILTLLAAVQLKHWQAGDRDVFSKRVVRYGAEGGDVFELQGRLKYLGYYTGKIDGDYGYRTLRSVKWFQSQFGLRVDGVVGPKTKLRLWSATRHWRPGTDQRARGGRPRETATGRRTTIPAASRRGFTDNDIRIIANAVHGEARGEPYRGQVAVAAVILNRLEDPNFPHTVHGVIFQPGAFTAVADGQIWLTPNASSQRAVRDAINGVDPTNGCIYYFNPVTATSKWIWSRPQVLRIGKHIFCN